jgi:hypothetical protein
MTTRRAGGSCEIVFGEAPPNNARSNPAVRFAASFLVSSRTQPRFVRMAVRDLLYPCAGHEPATGFGMRVCGAAAQWQDFGEEA